MIMLSVTLDKLIIPTYPEPGKEEMPMFAENRVHQRTSGNPYPNRIVLKVEREYKTEKEYKVIRLENDYLRLEILPEIGGRIYSAYDKTTGYDFFYKQHVIKPALIGCLGLWISGGVEFNWPFHHRASTFMPADYYIERTDGEVTVWLSEHDPMDRMKGMVGVSLKSGEAKFETKVRLFNRTAERHSFLWWENTAVPVNKEYQIFFPQDVSYVNFHYKRSVTTFPVASNALGLFNGIRYDGDTDISMHKNTHQPTSYFSAPSEYDFFGGFDHGKKCGVVHIADHHISPGKKMFTWAYNQLSESWENALTDSDGAYAELMAGVYSDNQPDLSWIEPYETKVFSQSWFPIGDLGVPCFANLNLAVHWEEGKLVIQATKNMEAEITVTDGEKTVFKKKCALLAGKPSKFSDVPKKEGYKLSVMENGKTVAEYENKAKELYNIPDTTEDMPYFKEVKTAGELYLEGVHVMQYRDPAVKADSYFNEALLRDPEHIPSLSALAEIYYEECDFEKALSFALRAEAAMTKFNKRPESGRLYYVMGKIHNALGDEKTAYGYFYKASWNYDLYSAAMTHIAAIDGKRRDYDEMLRHSTEAAVNSRNLLARAYKAIAEKHLKMDHKATLDGILKEDPLYHLARYLRGDKDFYESLYSDMSQTCIDLATDLAACGEDTKGLLENLPEKEPMVYYMTGDFIKAENTPVKNAFPKRVEEYLLLKNIDLPMAHYYLGCLLYSKRQYKKAASEFEKTILKKPEFYIPYRNLAALYYSHLGRKDEALSLIDKAIERGKESDQLIFEKAYLMCKLGSSPDERIAFLEKNLKKRDDIYIELARAYNENGDYDKALKLLEEHTFVPCEGGEHAVAEEYMLACHGIGRTLLKEEKPKQAAEYFKKALILPKNLGAGLWNECRTVAHKFYLAKCFSLMGESGKAKDIYDYILSLKIDYFSNMHLPELPYYQAEAFKACGDFLAGRALIDKYLKKWTKAKKMEDPGYFGTTPFFISYIDSPKEQREAYYSYLLGFAYEFTGDNKRAKMSFSEAAKKDRMNIFYGLESKFDR